MRKITLFFTLTIITLSAVADEGMWIPLFLQKYNIAEMQKKGFKLTAEDIYSVNKASMKDAVMLFGGGCTAEVISDKGLIITNHHCGFSRIQAHSTLEHDYLTDGFWAKSTKEELPNPGLTVTFLVYMEDVTVKILSQINDNMPMKIRKEKIEEIIKKIEHETELKSKNKYKATIESFFYGNQYIMMVTQIFEDIRLVGAPPSAIGKFGGDTDNWVWPRHTGDFSMFRIYADKNNQPAQYSPNNQPYKPKKSFPINIKGVKKGDFTMIFGYPGTTKEYLPAQLVDNIINTMNPNKIMLRQKKLDIIQKAMDNNRKTRIQYASKQARIANGWKKWIGQNQGLKRIGIIKEKKDYEHKFKQWTNTTEGKKYKNIIKEYNKYGENIKEYEKAYIYFIETIYYLDLYSIYGSYKAKIKKLQNSKDEKNLAKNKKEAINSLKKLYKDYDPQVDIQIFKEMMKAYFKNIDPKYYPDFYDKIKTSYNNNVDKFADQSFKTSILTNLTKATKFIQDYNIEKKEKFNTDFKNDPIVEIIESSINNYYIKIEPEYIFLDNKIDSLNHLYMQAQMKMETNKKFYPDANLTLRLAYGTVNGFKPRDGIIYNFYTTLDGVIAKDNPQIYDYDVPDKLKELYLKKNYGRYADKKTGKIHVCFIADNHTTGGNSGSPVINANGELIGINFDRCWESTMSDIKYDPNYCRNIALDMRYVLFLIDKYAGADYLLKEMKIVE